MARRKGKKNKSGITPPVPVKVKTELLPALDLSYFKSAVVRTSDYESVEIVLVGCGGTGSYLAQHLCKSLRAVFQGGKGARIVFIDPDIVKEENVFRQNFCEAEAKEQTPKAVTLARRYGSAWGINTKSVIGTYDEKYLSGDCDLTLLIGCVDNAEGRRAISETLNNNIMAAPFPPPLWYLDCGNLRDTGQVLLGSAPSYELLAGCFPDSNTCVALPSPTLQCPDLLKPRPEELGGNNLSCAEMAAANSQSMSINSEIAAQAGDFVARLLVTKNLRRFACEVNLASGSVRSSQVNPEEIARITKKPISYLTKSMGTRESEDEFMLVRA